MGSWDQDLSEGMPLSRAPRLTGSPATPRKQLLKAQIPAQPGLSRIRPVFFHLAGGDLGAERRATEELLKADGGPLHEVPCSPGAGFFLVCCLLLHKLKVCKKSGNKLRNNSHSFGPLSVLSQVLMGADAWGVCSGL